MIAAYAALLSADDVERRDAAVRAWSAWESSASHLRYDLSAHDASDNPERSRTSAIIENHYLLNGGFLDGRARDQDYLLNNIAVLKDIPVHIVQVRYDQVCPMFQAEELVAALRKAGSISVEYVVTLAGHSGLERENHRALTNIMDALPTFAPS